MSTSATPQSARSTSACEPETKRIKKDEPRIFQSWWSRHFGFVEHNGKCLCLHCGTLIATYKSSNLKRHLNIVHEDLMKMHDDERMKLCLEAYERHIAGGALPMISDNRNMSRQVTYSVAFRIAQHCRPFTDGNFVRECLQDFAEITERQRMSSSEISRLGLGRTAIREHIAEVDDDLKSQLRLLLQAGIRTLVYRC